MKSYQFESGKEPGNFQGIHHIATDSKGNIYAAEVAPGARAQKFDFKGMSSSMPANALTADDLAVKPTPQAESLGAIDRIYESHAFRVASIAAVLSIFFAMPGAARASRPRLHRRRLLTPGQRSPATLRMEIRRPVIVPRIQNSPYGRLRAWQRSAPEVAFG